jgi:hypothetical protein
LFKETTMVKQSEESGMKLKTVIVAGLLVSNAAFATNLTSQDPLPPFMSGGVGAASQQAIKQAERHYNLKLMFTGEGGMYLANVSVSIRDTSGNEVVNTVTEGPILLAKLAPGRYVVEAAVGMYNKKQNVTVGKGLKTIQMPFPVTDANREAISKAHPNFGVPAAPVQQDSMPSQVPFGYGTPAPAQSAPVQNFEQPYQPYTVR